MMSHIVMMFCRCLKRSVNEEIGKKEGPAEVMKVSAVEAMTNAVEVIEVVVEVEGDGVKVYERYEQYCLYIPRGLGALAEHV
jgi:hypothetical protein